MDEHARRIAKGLAAARRACALDNTPLSADQFEAVVDQMALAAADNTIGPFNYDAFLAEAYRLPTQETAEPLKSQSLAFYNKVDAKAVSQDVANLSQRWRDHLKD